MKTFKQLFEHIDEGGSDIENKFLDGNSILGNHYNKFTDKHRDEIANYTSGSVYLNDDLWRQHKGNYTSHYSKQISILDNALKKHKTPDSLTVHSGTPHDPREHMNNEGIVHHPAYLSTSLSSDVAYHFALNHLNDKTENDESIPHETHVLKIHVPKNHPGAYVNHISAAQHEQEFILPRDTKLKHIKTSTEKLPEIGTKYTHHMEVVK